MQIFDRLPQALRDKAVDLATIGVRSHAWTINDALELLKWLESNEPGVLVLGGDLYLGSSSTLEPAYENWYYEPRKVPQDPQASRDKAREFLRNLKTHPRTTEMLVDLVVA